MRLLLIQRAEDFEAADPGPANSFGATAFRVPSTAAPACGWSSPPACSADVWTGATFEEVPQS